jgi:hypothetical protein
MALQHAAQSVVLRNQRPMHHPSALLIERLERTRKSFAVNWLTTLLPFRETLQT